MDSTPATRSAVSERLKRRAMDAAPVGITIADATAPDEPLVYVNDAFVRVTGYSREYALGRNCRFLQGEDTDPGAVDRLRQAIDERRHEVVELKNYRKDGEPFWNRVEIAPLRDEAGDVTHFVGFQLDVTARREAERAVREERAALSRLVDRINGLLEGVTGVLIRATSVQELRRQVTRQITRTDSYVAAWIGEAAVREEAVRPDGDSLALANADPEAVALPETVREGAVGAALSGGDIQVETDLSVPVGAGAASMAAIPLTYRDATQGVLAVYADDAEAFDESERVVLASLGRALATALDALETQRVLTVEPEVSVEIAVRDDLWLIALAADLGTALEYVGTMRRDDGRDVLTFVVEDTDQGAIETAVAELPAVEVASIVADHRGGVLVDLVPDEESPVSVLATLGARTDSLTVTGDEAQVTCTLPGGEDVRGLMDALSDRYERVELRAKRQRTDVDRSPARFVDAVRERLTDRQETALRRAFVAGYFDRPRGADGDTLAESMGITRSTFHQHLSAAQRKLLEAFFE